MPDRQFTVTGDTMFTDNRLRWPDWLAVLIPLSFYLYTCAPGIGFGDTAIMVDNMVQGHLDSQVNTHSLSVLLGHWLMYLPLTNLAFKANLLSVVAGSLTVWLFYLAVRQAFASRLLALVMAGVLMVSKTMWWHSTVVENYAVSSIITAAALLAWVRLWQGGGLSAMCMLFFLAGLGLFNHMQMGFLGMGVGVTFLLQLPRQPRRWHFFFCCGAAFIVGLVPWASLLIRDMLASAQPVLTVKSAFVGVFGQTFFSVGAWQGLKDTAVVYLLDLPQLLLPLPFVGLLLAPRVMGWSPSYFGMLVFLLANTVCFTYYNTWDRFAFLLQSLVLLVFFASFALQALRTWLTRRTQRPMLVDCGVLLLVLANLGWSVYFYDQMTEWGKDPDSYWYRNYNNNYSNNLYEHSRFVIDPNKRDYREVDIFAERLFARLPQDAIYIDDDSRTYYPLADYFQKYYHQRPDVRIQLINSWSIDGWGNSPGDLARLIERAYQQGQPVFMASLQWPYSLILERLPAQISFTEFPIADDRWIYQMVAAQEVERPTDFVLPGGYLDLDITHLSTQTPGFYTNQDMSSFAGAWHFGDQLFANLPAAGAELVLVLDSEFTDSRQLSLYLTQAPDFARVRIAFNETVLVDSLDLYAPQVQPLKLTPPDKVDIQQGINLLIITVLSPAEDGGYRFGIDGIGY